MSYPAVEIFIDGEELTGYTGLSLSRSKDELTGSAEIELFYNYSPERPIFVNAGSGRKVEIYIGGFVAFTGRIDKRSGSGHHNAKNTKTGKHGKGRGSSPESSGDKVASIGIGANEYTVQLTARGKTKYLIDSSHQHKTTNMLKPTTKKAVETLVEPFGVELEWMGTEIELDKVRFRDGARVIDELHRVAIENGYYMYETREGKLRVTDGLPTAFGDDLLLGENILRFTAEQNEELAKSEITVKGQRNEKNVWGEAAVLDDTISVVKDKAVSSYIPVTVQHYGNGTREALERRARFEANKRMTKAKKFTVEVFHVQPQRLEPWDIGLLHYVECPPEGIFDVLECTGLKYEVQPDQTLNTTLTLSPPPAGATKPADGLASFASPLADYAAQGDARRQSAGITFEGYAYPVPWGSPVLSVESGPLSAALALVEGVAGLASFKKDDEDKSPAKLPPSFEEDRVGGKR